MPKWESMIFIAIVFTILKDMDNEIVMQNHYVCCNYFDKYFRRCSFFSQQIISISRKFWEHKYTKIFHKWTSCRSLRFGTAVPKLWRIRLSPLVDHSDLKTLVFSLMSLSTCVSHSDLELLALLIAWLIKQSRIYESSRLIKLSAFLTH